MARSFEYEYEYDVFVSFCEEDTRTSFTGHLFAAFDRKKIRAYRGEEAGPELLKEIKTSNIAVVVFSKNYATSHLCLDELVKIMECKRLFNQRVIPVFYDVSPSEVRKQKGNLAEALLMNAPEDKVNSWKVALTDAANLAGLHLKPYRPEPEFIEEIVEVIWKRLKGESSTVQSRRQIDNPGAGEDFSITISQNDASSVQNAIAEWSRPFFFLCVS
ncbi:hypothetical protein ACB092_12G213400 [Castanea dentata]